MQKRLIGLSLGLFALGALLCAQAPVAPNFMLQGAASANAPIQNILTLCAPAAVGTCSAAPLTGTTSITATGTIVTKINVAALGPISGTPTKVRVSILNLNVNVTLSAAYIGQAQTGTGTCSSGAGVCAWNFASSPTQITWNGGATSIAVPASLPIITSDFVTWPGTSSALTIAFNQSVGASFFRMVPAANSVIPATNFNASNYNVYYLNSVGQAATVLKNSGYTNVSGNVAYIQAINVQ